MKKYIFIFAALIVSLWSCQKDLDLYSGRDFIYFNPSAGLDSTYFSFAYVDVNKEVDSLYIMVRTGGEVKGLRPTGESESGRNECYSRC